MCDMSVKWVPSSLASLRLSGRAGFPVCSNGSSKYTRTLPVSLGGGLNDLKPVGPSGNIAIGN